MSKSSIPSYQSLEAQFKKSSYELGEARRRNERVRSGDSLRDYNQAVILADTILDLTIQTYPEVVKAWVPDHPISVDQS